MKITAYVVHDQGFVSKPVHSPEEILDKAVWIDVIDPTKKETLHLADRLRLFVEIKVFKVTARLAVRPRVRRDRWAAPGVRR